MTIPGAIVASALRVLVGSPIGFVAAVVTGILISASQQVSDMVLPVVRGLAPIAPIAWIPLGIVLFGIGNPTAVFVVFMGVYFILTISTVAAVKAVDERLIKTARSHGASKAQIWTRVIFPAMLPQVFTMLRINFFAAWMAVLAAEMVGLKNGLGMMIILGREMFNTKLILLGMCMVGATGYFVDALLVQIQRKILWWQPVAMKTLACQHVNKVWTSPGGLSVRALNDIDLTVQQRRVRRHPRSERLRQEHAARADRRARAGLLRTHRVRRQADHRPRARRGDGVPGALAVPVAVGAGQCRLRPVGEGRAARGAGDAGRPAARARAAHEIRRAIGRISFPAA